MKKSLLLIASIAILFASCDKVENYVVYSGQSGDVLSGTGVSEKVQRIFIEKYTGPRCTNCPAADSVIHSHLEQNPNIIAVSIVDSSTFGNPYLNQPDFRTDAGNAWSKYFGIIKYPTMMVNRATSGNGFNLITSTDEISQALTGQPALPKVAIDLFSDGTKARAVLEFVGDYNGGLTLTLMVIEDSLIAKQASPNGAIEGYVSNHILRDVITDIWGTDVPCQGTAGTKITLGFNFTLREDWVPAHCKLVALLSDKATRSVVNCAQCNAL